tara:strand:- start:9 stop:1145 length:1137 start_codon:yes stop_codon:yes gene_type:complete
VLSLPPSPFIVKTTFTKPNEISVLRLNKMGHLNETMETVHSSFLRKLNSKVFQKKVFIEGGYLTKLSKENEPINDIDGYISGFTSSISIEIGDISQNGVGSFEEPCSVSITVGESKVSVATEFLDYLVAKANITIISDYVNLINQKIASRLVEISTERSLLLTRAQRDRLSQIERIKEKDDQKLRELNNLIDAARYKAKENRLNHMIILTSAAKLASSLGVTEHNLDQISLQEENFNLNIALGEENLPDWYLYGEKALIERIKLLESRISDDPFIPELVTLQNQINEIQENNLLKTLEKREDDTPFISRINALDIEKIRLESFNIEQDGINAMILNQAAFASQYSNKNKQIIVLAIFGSFILSIILALMMNLFKEDEA